MLKDYDMSVHYHPWKANVIVGALNRLSMGSTIHIYHRKKELVKDVHRMTRLGSRLMGFTRWGILVHPRSKLILGSSSQEGSSS